MSGSLRPHGLSMEFSGQNTGVGSRSLLQGIFPTQGSNLGLPHCRRILYQLSHKGSPLYVQQVIITEDWINSVKVDYKWFFTSLVAQLVKNPPAMQETWVQSLGWEDPLEEGMETHSSILVWTIPQTEEPGGATVHGVAKSRT